MRFFKGPGSLITVQGYRHACSLMPDLAAPLRLSSEATAFVLRSPHLRKLTARLFSKKE
jgi:hypothetical protein